MLQTDQKLSSQQPRHWVFWLLFFFQYAAIGVFFIFLNVYYRNAGLSGTQIGIINMVTGLVGVGSSVLWGYISDRSGLTRYLIAFGAAGSLIVMQFIPLVHTFSTFLGLGVLSMLLNSAPSTLVDSATLIMLGEKREEYGRYRVAGSIGFIITSLSAGYIYDSVGLRWMFPAYGFVMIFLVGTAFLLPRRMARLETRPQKGSPGFRALIIQPRWVLFMSCVFLVWIAVYASITFLGVSLSALGANQGLIGLVVTVGAVAELPFMAFSGKIIRRYGARKLLLVAMILLFVRFLLLSLLKAPQWAIAINLLNGPAFAFYWNSAVTYANRMAPTGFAGTAQGMLNSTTSLAGVISSLLTGWLFDQVGPTRLFLVMGILCLAALCIFWMGSTYIDRKTKEAL